jgi:hypothetical protein
VEETGVPGENHRPVASHKKPTNRKIRNNLYIIFIYKSCLIYFFCTREEKGKCVNIIITIGLYIESGQDL